MPFVSFFLGFLFVRPQQLEKPLPLPTEEFDSEIGFRANVNGREVDLALKPFWPNSYLSDGDGKVAKVMVGDKTLAKVAFNELGDDRMPKDADGVLGQDALRQMTLVLDPVLKTVRFVAQTKISQERAESLLNDLPSWGGQTKVVRIPLKRTPDGVPTLAAMIDGQAAALMLRLSFYDTFLDASVGRPAESVSPNDWSYLAHVDLGGLPTSWVAYAPRNEWAPEEEREGAGGMLALDAFHSRRVIVDLAGDALYVENLPEEARLSLAISEETALPILVEGGKLVIGPIPGEEEEAPSLYPKGAEVRSIAGVDAQEWIADLKAGTAEAAGKMAKRILKLDHDFDLVVRGVDGKDQNFTIPRETPAPPASLRAVGRAPVASSSR